MIEVANDTIASIIVDLVDSSGASINAQSASYTLFGADDAVLTPPTTIAGFVVGSSSVTISIDAVNNALPTGKSIDSRRVAVEAVDLVGKVFRFDKIYVIRGAFQLEFMVNSYQTLQHAEMLAAESPGIDAYLSASNKNKINALIEAYRRLGMMTYSVNFFGQNSIDYVTETNTLTSNSFPGQHFRPRYVIVNRINDMTPNYILSLPSRFLEALRQGQLIEANYILSGGDKADERRDGVLSKKVGEASTTYRFQKPLSLPVCRDALNAMTGYIHYGSRLGRG